MTLINHTKIPAGTKIHQGSRGSHYIIRNGQKVYVRYGEQEQYPSAKDGWNTPRVTPRRKFNAKRGAYLRFIENQSQLYAK